MTRIINHPVIAYLIISVVSLGAAFLFFEGAGSFAEVIGPENKMLGFSFRAGGAIAGFIIIFVLSKRALLNFDKNLKGRNPEWDTIRKELQKILYGPEFLNLMSNSFKEIAWKNVTRSINNSFFTQIGEEIVNVIYNKFIPQDIDIYYKDCEVCYSIRETADKSHIEIIELMRYKAIPKSRQMGLDFFDKVQGLDSETDKSELQITRLLVNGTDYSIKVAEPKTICQNGIKIILLESKFIVDELADEFNIVIEKRTVHTRQLGIFWRRNIQKYTHSFQIEIYDDKQVEVDLIQIGQVIDFKPIGQQVNSFLQKHEGLLIPGDGYIIFVK